MNKITYKFCSQIVLVSSYKAIGRNMAFYVKIEIEKKNNAKFMVLKVEFGLLQRKFATVGENL